jgi:molecular chaperone GrpE
MENIKKDQQHQAEQEEMQATGPEEGSRESNGTATDSGPDSAADESLSVEEKLAKAEEELEACKDKVLRLAAELENFKKRTQREKEEHIKYALETFAKELLPFLDNLERAIEAARESKDIDKLLEGLDLTLSGYFKTLEKFGLKVFAAEGKRFDPNYHEALTTEVNHNVEENTVVKELLKGYTLHERVLRPAMVVVSKKDSQEQ